MHMVNLDASAGCTLAQSCLAVQLLSSTWTDQSSMWAAGTKPELKDRLLDRFNLVEPAPRAS